MGIEWCFRRTGNDRRRTNKHFQFTGNLRKWWRKRKIGGLTMNLQEELKALKERIAELEEQEKYEQEFPKVGYIYWRIDDRGSVDNSLYNDYYTDKRRQAIGNFFKTKKQAEFAAEKLKVEAELRKFSRPFEYGKFNYYLFFDIDGNSIITDFTSYCPPQGAIYFESEEKAQQAIEAVGIDRIKKYIFGVED